MTGAVMTDAAWFRNRGQRELPISGLRLATDPPDPSSPA